jgi:hypothetical protein
LSSSDEDSEGDSESGSDGGDEKNEGDDDDSAAGEEETEDVDEDVRKSDDTSIPSAEDAEKEWSKAGEHTWLLVADARLQLIYLDAALVVNHHEFRGHAMCDVISNHCCGICRGYHWYGQCTEARAQPNSRRSG